MRASERVRARFDRWIVERFAGLETVEPFAQLLARAGAPALFARQLAPPSQAMEFYATPDFVVAMADHDPLVFDGLLA